METSTETEIIKYEHFYEVLFKTNTLIGMGPLDVNYYPTSHSEEFFTFDEAIAAIRRS